MKKKIYFIISSIIGILSSSYLIFNVGDTIKEAASLYKGLPDVAINLLTNPNYYYAISAICIVLLLVIMILSIINLEKYRNVLIGLTIALFFVGTDLTIILAIVNLVILAKTEKKTNKIGKEKKELPVLDEPVRDKWSKIKAVILIALYFFLLIILPKILGMLNIEFKNYATARVLLNLGIDIILLLVALIFFYKEVVAQFKIYIKNIKPYLKEIGKSYLIYFALVFVYVVILLIFKQSVEESVNQTSLSTLPIWYLLFGTIIYAPIVEELVFRGSLRKLIKNNYVFIIISGLSFGLIHTLGQEATIIDALVKGIPYVIIGFILARLYAKTNNICSNINYHAIQNTLAVLLLIITK